MQQPAAVDLHVTLSADGEYLLFRESDGSSSGFYVVHERPGVELVVSLADFLQDQVFPETREAWAEARPGCPGHRHPATPAVVDGEAWWLCPASSRRLSVIGAYKHPEASSEGR